MPDLAEHVGVLVGIIGFLVTILGSVLGIAIYRFFTSSDKAVEDIKKEIQSLNTTLQGFITKVLEDFVTQRDCEKIREECPGKLRCSECVVTFNNHGKS